MSTRSRVVLLGILAVGLIAVVVGVSVYDGRQDIEIRDLLADGSGFAPYLPDGRVATEELCGEELPCVAAWDASTLSLYQFSSRDEAERAARRFGESGHLSGWIVTEFKQGGLEPRERQEFIGGLNGVNTNSPD